MAVWLKFGVIDSSLIQTLRAIRVSLDDISVTVEGFQTNFLFLTKTKT